MKKRAKPEAREVILQVRPSVDANHPWWPVSISRSPTLTAFYEYASIDPYDPPGWSAGLDDDYKIDSIELWKQTKLTLAEHTDNMKAEWLEEYGKDDEGDGFEWEFRVWPVVAIE